MSVHLLVFEVGAESFAIPLEGALEILRAPAVTPLPVAPRPLLGVLNVRGEVVPLFDVGALLGVGATDPQAAVLVDSAHGPAALAASGIPATTTLTAAPAVSDVEATVGAFSAAGRVIHILDVGELLSPDRVAGEA